MNYVIGALVGIAWGAAVSFLNYFITKRSLAKQSTSAVMGTNLVRNVVNIVALAVVFLLRKYLPFSYEATLIATAIAMSAFTIFLTFKLSKKI